MTQEIKFNNEIQIDVQEPTNVTNNESFIGKKPWTTQSKPNVDGSDKSSWFGQLMSCMELDWGGAKGISGENNFKNNTNMESQIGNLLFNTGIQTSDELIKVLCWLYANRYQEPVIRNLSVSGTTTVNYNDTITLTAAVSGEGGDASVTTWKWNTSNSNFGNNSISGITFTPSNNGASTTLKMEGNNQSYNSWQLPNPTATSVTLSSATGSSTCECTPGTASRPGKQLKVFVQASNFTATNSTVVEECTFRAPSPQSQVATDYSWSIVSGTDYIRLTNTTLQTCTITGKNSTYVPQTAKIKCTVTYGANGTKDTSDITVTVPAANITLTSIEWVSTTASSTYGQPINLPQIQLNYSNGTNEKINSNDSELTYSTILTSSTNAGSYSITATYNGDKTTTNTLNYTINKANLSLTVNISGWTAGDPASTPIVTGNTGNGTVTYKYKVNTAADSTYTTTVPTTAGTYIIQATVAETTNYNSGTATKQFTITQPAATYYWYVGRQDTNGGEGTLDWENTNYEGFMSLNRQSGTLAEIKTALTGSVSVGQKATGKEDVIIIAPSEIVNQITSIKNASDSFNVTWDKMTPSNGYITIFIENYASTTLNIHF